MEIGERERGNSRSIDDVRYEEEEESPNITRVDCLETDQRLIASLDVLTWISTTSFGAPQVDWTFHTDYPPRY